MRRRLLPLAALPLSAALVAAPGAPGSPPAADAPRPVLAGISMSGLDALLAPAQEPGDPMLAMRGGNVPTGAFAKASAQAAAVTAQTAAADPALAGARWQLRGPTNVGGRVLDVVVDPLRKDALYAATASGGVWHSTDAGRTYRSVWPDDLVQAIGALDVSPTGVLWAGTGEAGPGGGSITYGGTGVYRSADGGRTWQSMGLQGTERIGRVVVDPKDEKTVWVAANGPLYSRGGERGLYKTTDGGKSWKLVLAGANDTTGAVDVAVSPDGSVYAAMWDRIREPDRRLYTGVGSGAFKSTDGGATWTRIGGPSLASQPTLGRMGVAVAPSNPDRVYLVSSTELGLETFVYRSDDAGTTFLPGVQAQLPLLQAGPLTLTGGSVFAWWFGRIYVDPDDPDVVYPMGLDLQRSTDGGLSFEVLSGVHADQHGMDWDPRTPGRVYLGNDGGTYRSDDDGATYEHGEFMPWNQPFSVSVSQQNPSKLLVGLQDNGGNRNYVGDEDPGPDQYNDITGGDGTEMTFDPDDDAVVYGCSQYGVCARSTRGGDGMSSFENEILGLRKNWLTPIEFDPKDPDTVYTASEIVHRSTDGGETWEPISPDLTGGFGRETNPLFRSYGTVTTIAAAVAEHDTIYAGTDDGRVQYTHDGGATWVRATGLPTDWVTAVTVDRRDPAKVAYATFSGFRSGNEKALVFRTADGGATWKDISGNLPQAPVNDILQVGGDLVVATDVGVFLSRNLGGTWLKIGSGMPNAPITSLDWQAAATTLLASNFGRGAYSVSLPSLGKAALPAPAARPLPRTGLPVPAGDVAAADAAAPPVEAEATSDVAAAPVADRGVLPAGVPVAVAALLALTALGGLALSRRRA